jgi:hypothetical protein
MLWGVFFYFFVVGDANGYWEASRHLKYEQFWLYLFKEKGTAFIYALNFFPANVIGLSYFSGTLLYCLLGYIGLIYFYVITIKVIPFNSKIRGYSLFPLVFFSPNLNFWSSGIGKDTLLFLFIGMFSYGILNISKRIPLIILSLLLSYFVRPHIMLFLLLSFSLVYLLTSKIAVGKRVVLGLLLVGAGVAILPSVLRYVKIEEISIGDFNKFSEVKASVLSRSHTGSRIDISSYPLPLKIFTFLYRPLFFDINSITGVFASLENLILLILSWNVFKRRPIETFKQAPFIIKGFVFFLILGTLAFSNSLGNLGIMIRMRNMFLPGMFLFILWSFSYDQQRKLLLLKRRREASDRLDLLKENVGEITSNI